MDAAPGEVRIQIAARDRFPAFAHAPVCAALWDHFAFGKGMRLKFHEGLLKKTKP